LIPFPVGLLPMSGGGPKKPDGSRVGRLVTVAGGGVTDPPDLANGKWV